MPPAAAEAALAAAACAYSQRAPEAAVSPAVIAMLPAACRLLIATALSCSRKRRPCVRRDVAARARGAGAHFRALVGATALRAHALAFRRPVSGRRVLSGR